MMTEGTRCPGSTRFFGDCHSRAVLQQSWNDSCSKDRMRRSCGRVARATALVTGLATVCSILACGGRISTSAPSAPIADQVVTGPFEEREVAQACAFGSQSGGWGLVSIEGGSAPAFSGAARDGLSVPAIDFKWLGLRGFAMSGFLKWLCKKEGGTSVLYSDA